MTLRLTLIIVCMGAAACSVYDPSLVDRGLAGVPERPAASTSKSSDQVEAVFADIAAKRRVSRYLHHVPVPYWHD